MPNYGLSSRAAERRRVQIWFYPPPLKRHRTAAPELAYVAIIRENYRRVVWQRAEWHQRLALWLALPTWPLWASLEALRFSLMLGPRVRGETGKSRLRQFNEQIALAWRNLIPPAAYYTFELYLDAHRQR